MNWINKLLALFQKPEPEEFGLGAILDYKDTRDISLSAVVAPDTEQELPDEVEINDSELTVYNQGKKGTCVAHVLASIKQFTEKRDTGLLRSFSRRFIYHFGRIYSQLFDNSNEGLRPRETFKVLYDKGVPLDSEYDEGGLSMDHDDYVLLEPSQDVITSALDNRIEGYVFVGTNLNEFKLALMKNIPFGVSLPVDKKAWDRKTGVVSKPDPNNFSGRHYVKVRGVKGEIVKFRNSWGIGWGDKGKGTFNFYDYAQYMRDIIGATDVPKKLIDDAKQQSYLFVDTLKIGMQGEAVKQLQKRLYALGLYTDRIDGNFGLKTKYAVMEFQKKNGLVADGICGKNTNNILNAFSPAKKMSLIEALIQVESQGNDNAIGDKHLTDKAYGCLQIRKPCIDDVNKFYGTNYKPQDMLGNRALSIDTFKKYMDIYATSTQLKRIVTDEDRARIWNGGPTGYKRSTTLPYWDKVRKLLA